MMRVSKSLVSRVAPLGRRSWRGFAASGSPPFDSSEHPDSPPPANLEQLLKVMKQMDTKLDNMEKQMDAKLNSVEENLEKQMDAKLDSVEKNLEKQMDAKLDRVEKNLEKKFGKLEQNMSSIDERLFHVERKLGHSLEQHVRVEVSKLHGESYQRRLVAKSLVDLLELFPPELLVYSEEGPALSVVKTAKDVAMKLLAANVPGLFLAELNKLSPCVNGNGEPILEKIREIKKLGDVAAGNLMDTAIKQLVSYYSCKNDYDRVEQLVSAEGPGILFLLFAVNKSIIFAYGRKCFSPFVTLEFDLRGSIELVTQDNIIVDIGEVKSSCATSWMEAGLDANNGMTKSIRQLALRLNVLAWLIKNSFGEKRKLEGKPVTIMKIGITI